MHRLLTSRWSVAVVATLITAGVVGSVGYALADPAGGAGSTFYACSTASGFVRSDTIRVNQPPTFCPRGETITSWNAQGTAGATGAQGPAGEASVVELAPPLLNCATAPEPTAAPPADGSGAFLDVPNIPGESTDAHHRDQIDVLSWSWGVTGAGRESCGAGTGAGPSDRSGTQFQDLTVVKYVDKASPKLLLALDNGTHLGTVKLSIAKQGADYLVITLANALLTSESTTALHGSDIRPEEQLTFDATKVTFQYAQQNGDGTFNSPLIACYDVSLQVAC